MFDAIRSVIGDIASGAVKDQRIALSQEQLAALDLKLRDTLAENSSLKLRIGELEKELVVAYSKVDQLTEEVQKEKQADRPEAEHKILLHLSTHTWQHTDQIVTHFGMSGNAALLHLNHLQQDELVVGKARMGAGITWNLRQGGREYLSARDLLG